MNKSAFLSPGSRLRFSGLLSLLAVCLLSGCFRVTAIIPNVAPTDVHSQWVNGFFWGAVGGTVNTGYMCGGRPVAAVTTKRSVGNLFISWLTLGIYTPSKIWVACGQGGVSPPGSYPPPGTYVAPPAY